MVNKSDTRKRILTAATNIFAEKSCASMRIKDIAKNANVPIIDILSF